MTITGPIGHEEMRSNIFKAVFHILVIYVILNLYGCAFITHKIPAPCGVTGYIDLPAGSKIQGVPLPTDENKAYTVVTPKAGFWMSTECMGRLDR
jgi:hypothetical protein